MDKRYIDYCLVDRLFYDSPLNGEDAVNFEIASRPLPGGWHQRGKDDWLVYGREDVKLPMQGWKVHVSGCADNAEKILVDVWNYCIERGIGFKHLRGPHVLVKNNSKYANRGSSGKLVTIYPVDEAQLRRVLTELGELLEGQPGPYILSDLRWGNGPLYVRYGGFAQRHCLSDKGELELAIEDPDGRLVPDRREAGFRTPPWVTLPAFLAPHLEARNSTTVQEIPYRIERALHFSNGGGLYVGTDTRTGEQVVLKEARPHAGLDAEHADAVSRLQRERTILEHLAGIETVPAVRDYFTLGGHHFLVQEYVEGSPLNREFSARFPLVSPDTENAGPIREYTEWAMGVIGEVDKAVAAMHERGVIFGDLHMFNVMVRPDNRIAMIDFEVASLIEENRRPTLGNPGFAAPRDRTGFAIDRYALACLRMAMFIPLTTLFRLDPAKVGQLAPEIEAIFPLPAGYLDEAVREITGRSPVVSGPGVTAGTVLERSPDGRLDRSLWEPIRRSLADAILASATPERDDRLFPGDVEQFMSGGLGIAYGAAGVLYALAEADAGTYPEHEEWLIAHATRPNPLARLGLYDGLHGVAYVLDRLGHRDEALAVVEICQREKWSMLGSDLLGGLSGIGLSLDHFAAVTGDPSLRDAAARVATLVADRLGDEESVATTSGGDHPYAGLMRGSSGPALLFIRRYERTGDAAFLDVAATALAQDLRRCITHDDGSMHVDEEWRTMPYVATGSVGIGLVLDQYLAHRPDEQRFAEAAAAISGAAESGHYVQSGLFNGRAGMILYQASRLKADACADPALTKQVHNLAWHALDYQGLMAFPGDQLYRLSMDVATGTAGVLLALAAVMRDVPATLPFLSRESAAL